MFAFDATSRPARLRRIGDARPGAAAGRGARRASSGSTPTLGGDAPGPGPDRRRRRDRGRGRRRRASRSSVPRRIVLISDLQQGSRLDALGEFEWPSDVELDLKTVATEGSNAGPAAARRAGRGRAGRRRRPSDLRRAGLERRDLEARDVRAGLGRRARPPTDPRLRPAGREPRRAGAAARRLRDRRGPCGSGETRRSSTTRSTSRPSRGRRRPSSTWAATRPTIPRAALLSRTASSQETPRRDRAASRRGRRRLRLTFEPGRVGSAGRPGGRDHGRERRVACGNSRSDGGTVLYVRHRARARRATLAALAGAPALDVEDSPAGRDAMLGGDRLRPSAFRPVRRRRSSTTSPRSVSGSIGASDAPLAGRGPRPGAVREGRPRGRSRRRWARGGWSCWPAAGARPTASSRGRRNSSR